MAQIENLQRSNELRADVGSRMDDLFRADLDQLQARPMETDEEDPEATVSALSNSPDNLFVAPSWLKGLFPIEWSVEQYRLKTVPLGRNCCLFYPLGYCAKVDVINGFCGFHLRAVFNLVSLMDASYMLNDQNKPVISQRHGCFVAEPQPLNNEYTAIFPVMELMRNEVQPQDIKLHNLSKHLQIANTPNWERIYAHHVNYLYRLCTLYSPQQLAQRPIETRSDQVSATQLMMHWNLWNEYHSNLLYEHPADISVMYCSGEHNNEVMSLPIKACTTITQMIARLFGECYTSLNRQQFFSTVAPYGIYAHAHWSYANNLCMNGTTCTSGNQQCIGNIATLPMLRDDSIVGGCKKSDTIHATKEPDLACSRDMCLPALMDPDAPTLNREVVVSAARQSRA